MDQGLIDYTEQRARALDLLYSRYLAPQRLLARVLGVEHEGLARLESPIPCFGKNFGGPDEPACAACQIQTACLMRTTSQALPEAEAQDPSPVAVAEALDAPLSALDLMHAMRLTVAELESGPVFLQKPVLKHGRGRVPVPDLSPYRLAPKSRANEGSDACLLSAQATETGWPAPVPSVIHRLGLRLRNLYAVARPIPDPPRKVFGNETFRARVKRCRALMPVLTWLPEGTILRRVYKNEIIEVRIYRDRFEYKGQPFATLAEIVGEIDGKVEYRMPPSRGRKGTRTMARISAAKFFDEALQAIYRRSLCLMHHRDVHNNPSPALPRHNNLVCGPCDLDFADALQKALPKVRQIRRRYRQKRAESL